MILGGEVYGGFSTGYPLIKAAENIVKKMRK